MVFMDYLFEILDNGNIVIDLDLTLEKLNAQVDNRAVLVKKIS